MPYTFRKAVREQVGLLIGLTGASGSGKTYSAMRLASGIAGSKPFAVIDTESRRALHYADMFKFDHCEVHPPFSPEAYTEVIKAAVNAKYPVIVIDSASHEWAGEGGVLDMQEKELNRMAGEDFRKREACKMASWIRPKMAHKKMVQSMLQVNTTMILCFRADTKIGMAKDSRGKTVIVDKGWQPICSKELPFEMTASFLLLPENPGFPQILKLQEQHKSLFSVEKQLNEESGKDIAKWAAGGKTVKKSKEVTEPMGINEDEIETISTEQQTELIEIAKKAGWPEKELMKLLKGYGFELRKDVTKDKFKVICDTMENPPFEDEPEVV